ncbi:phosphate ABC transporter substrate-binding protein [Salmonella enterica subsp. enterica]|uniref:Phosphate ABC transporter substrate-binding protein n=1 Tax=Salmonella enterica I TaxID=59201 RepID=A0A379US45_SALET|nr:phosphate ABC transporter substrate-binding protein [Salmonella enterica subsp. enterica]
MNNWLEVGGNDARIYPYQRPKGSGSQTIMLAAVMGEDKLRKPLETESVHDMIGLLRNVANYQNSAMLWGIPSAIMLRSFTIALICACWR